MVSLIIDILFVAIFLGILIFLTKYGVARAIKKLGKGFISFCCSLLLGPWLADKAIDLFLHNSISTGTYNSLVSLIESSPSGYNFEQLFQNLPEGFVNFLNGLGVNLEQLRLQYGYHADANDQIVRAMANSISEPIISIIGKLLGYAICFVVPLLIAWWVSRRIKQTEKPVGRAFDSVGGFITGCVLGYVAVASLAVLTCTLFQVSVAFNPESTIMTIYDSSHVFKFLREFDMLGSIQGLLGASVKAIA